VHTGFRLNKHTDTVAEAMCVAKDHKIQAACCCIITIIIIIILFLFLFLFFFGNNNNNNNNKGQAVEQWLRHYATSRKEAGSRPDANTEFLQFT
jgi:amino acid transporter